jgi:ABC-type phosphonate transport system ATPase subunit
VEQTALPDIRLRGLTKRYGDFAAVDGIDLDVGQGEFFTLLGPSGSRPRSRRCRWRSWSSTCWARGGLGAFESL